MSAASFLHYAHLAYLSKPKTERVVYRWIRRLRARSIVEIGIGNGTRAVRMVRVAAGLAGSDRVRYTGIDLFEARSQDRPGWTLKLAHRTLSALGAKVQLVPGDPYSGLARMANELAGTDLLIISGDQDQEALARAWFYVPRMLHERSRVFWQDSDPDHGPLAVWKMVGAEKIDALARQAQESRHERAA